jgi:outer membrane lipoprotein SlyB
VYGRYLVVALGAMILISACSSPGSDIIIDPAYVDRAQYEQDLAECERLADQVREKAGERAARGAVVGGLIGAVWGGDRSVERGAGVGAISGAAKGASLTENEKKRVIKNCLRNRGYSVLN